MRNLISCKLFIIAICTLILEPARGELALFPVGKLFAFAGHGLYPTGRLMEGADGNLYGTTSAGGKFGCGTVYKITPFETFIEMFAFAPTDGIGLGAGVLPSKDGNLYGVSVFGGGDTRRIAQGSVPTGPGTLFRISKRGELTTLCSFGGTNGIHPASPLTEGEDNALYGTTQGGGANGLGTIFRATKAGEVRTLHSFNGGDGVMPINSPLTDGGDGYLYGTIPHGGNGFTEWVTGQGTVFKITYAGAMTLLARFNGTNGMLPASGLTLGPDGAFYGTTAMGGASGFGTIYRISRSGDLTTLASFSGTNGAGPYSGLTLGPDGSFYGITAFRGKESGPSYGTIFKVTTNGVLTMVMALDGFLARNPTGELTLTSKGELWGVMNDMRKRAAGDGNAGLIFKLVESNYPHPAQTIATIARKPTTAEFTNGVLYLSGGKRQQKMN